jgi:hypothetical protein
MTEQITTLAAKVELCARKETLLATAQWIREQGLPGLADRYVQEFAERIEQAKSLHGRAG